MRGIAAALAVVVAATTVMQNGELLMARETFSGLQSMLANRQQLTVVEVVDDFSEASLGYLFGDMEPYDVEQAKRDGTMEELIDDLLTRGLLTTGETDDWNSYPLRYEIVDTAYSDYADDEEILSREGFRQQGEEAAEVSGYYVPIESVDGESAFYRCSTSDYEQMAVMTPSGLREAAKKIKDSYAGLEAKGSHAEGYTVSVGDGYQYFKFIAGDPKDAEQTQSASYLAVFAANGSGAGAVTGIGATGAADPEDAASGETDTPTAEEEEGAGSDGSTPAENAAQPDSNGTTPAENAAQPDSDGSTPADTGTPTDTPDTVVQPDSNGTTPVENAAQPESNGGTPSGSDAQSNSVPQADTNAGQADGVPQASAAIYVEFDADNSILVASLDNAGVGDVLDGAPNADASRQNGDSSPTPGSSTQAASAGGSSATAGMSAGVTPTIAPTPAPTPGSSTPATTPDDKTPSTTPGGSTPSTTPDDNASSPTPGGGTTPQTTPGTGNTDDLADPDADGNNDKDHEGEDENDADGEEEEEPSEEDPDDEGEDGTGYLITYEWEGFDSGIGTFTTPDLPGEETIGENGEFTVPEEPDQTIAVTNDAGDKIGFYEFAGWKVKAAGSDSDARDVSAGDAVSVTEDMTVIGKWDYQETACYTISYQWKLAEDAEDSLPSGVSADNIVLKSQMQTFDLSEQPNITPPEDVTVAEGSSYIINDDYEAGTVFDAYDADGNYIGTCTFEGWENSEGELQEGQISPDGDITLFGLLSFRSAEEVSYQFAFPWGSGNAGTLSDDGRSFGVGTVFTGESADDPAKTVTVKLKDGADLDRAIVLPDPQPVSAGGCQINGDYAEGTEILITETRSLNHGEIRVEIGKLVFSGWEETPGNGPVATDGTYQPGGPVTLTGTWKFVSNYAESCSVTYAWGLLEYADDGSSSVTSYGFPGSVDGEQQKLGAGAELPNGVKLPSGGYMEIAPKQPAAEYDWYQGMKYMPESDYAEGMKIAVFETGDELVGTYVFAGWELTVGGDADTARMLTSSEVRDGFVLEGSSITLRGVWEYEPEATADLIIGSGWTYVYVNDTIHNNDWFRYYVMGLEEKDFGKVNVRVVTYLADGSDMRAYGYKAAEDCPTLTEAIRKADLVYLNTNGVWMDQEGNTQNSGRRLSVENAKALLERACNEDRSARLAVILDNSVQGNQIDENVQKVAAILRQEDAAEAYASLSEDGMSYEKAFSSQEWQKLNASAVIRNGGNFVHDNIYCVSHARGEFNNSTYPGGESVVRPGRMPSLANADFENRFTDNVTDAGFAEVYQAIQKENYERSHNGSQASLDEYVMPATAVAFILNYQAYDPIIYKDQIRVLELQPCRDYTYYYDGQSGTTEFELKKKFAQDWAQDFIAKLDADPNAITIDGMTTSEFCGKILDIYEEYDVIYFGSNQGIMNRATQESGFKWVKVDAYDGTIGADNPYRPVEWEQNYYTYHDGNWYAANATGEKKMVRIDGPLWDWVDDSYTWDGTRNWKWNAAEKRWEVKTAETGWNWVPADHPYTDKWIEFNINGHKYTYDQRVPCWREERSVYTEGEIRPDGPTQGYTNWFDNGSAEKSAWMWKASSTEWGDEIKLTNDTSQRLYERGWYQKVWIDEVSYTNYALWGNNSDIDREMNGLLYTHIGGRIGRNHWGGGNVGHLASNETELGFRTSGNDILKTQVEELLHYLDGGSLIILAPEFMTENAAGGQIINSSDVWHTAGTASYRGILDTSSYVYQFVRQCFERKTDGTDVPRYPNLIVEDYGNGDLKDTEAFVEALNQQKVTLNLYSAPEAYRYDTVDAEYGRIDGDSRAMLKKAEDGKYYLNYEFMIGNLSAVAPLTTRYHVQLFLDSNSDGIYNTASEELTDITVINAQTGAVMERQGGVYQLQMSVPYRVIRELPDGYVGCIGWKLMVSQNGNAHIHDSVTGLTAVPVQPGFSDEINPETGKKVIHVLQITPDLWASRMDLEKQTEEDGDATIWVDGEMKKKNPGQYGTSDASRDWEWYHLLNELPDFEINFDSIYYWDFAHSFLRPGESGYDPQFDNGGVDGKLTGPYGRSDYLNLYQYDMVIVGFHDSIPSIPSQAAIDALLRYADTGKSMLFTHDTTYNSNFDSVPPDMFSSDALGQPFSMSIRELCAMDRFGVSVDWYSTDENGVKHSNVAVSPIRNTGGAAAVAYNESSGAYQWNASHPGGNSRDVAFAPGTNQTMMAAHTQGTTWVYTGTNSATVMFDWSSHGFDPLRCGHNMNRDTANPDKTCEVSRVNSGIITQYPYDIPEEIRVASTHGQYYQLDLDTDWDGDGRGDVVCWYAIKSLDDGDWNDIYDFSPNDVRNNYYIYNKGNITYSGVGHDTDHITLDEKKLFINTFVAAYNAGIRNPSVRIVEDGSVNAPDLESVSIPFNGVDEATAGTYRVYYQVKDNNITQGTRNLSIKYYIGNPAGSSELTYRTESGSVTISADLFGNDELITYSADTGLPVAYDQVRSGFSYYVDVPLAKLLDNEKFDFYVEVDLTMADDPGRVAAFDVDKLTIAKLKMFSLD